MAAVSLPSIHEMFPDHLLAFPVNPPPATKRKSASKQPQQHSSSEHHFDVLRSHPAATSLQSISDGEDDHEDRRHICRLCQKRFNRPSSLRIHMNTHTGATPFPCPFPGCGRSFNVNSNMRRHYRNHNVGAPPQTGSSSSPSASPILYAQPHPLASPPAPMTVYSFDPRATHLHSLPSRPDSCSSHSSASSSPKRPYEYSWSPLSDDEEEERTSERKRPQPQPRASGWERESAVRTSSW